MSDFLQFGRAIGGFRGLVEKRVPVDVLEPRVGFEICVGSGVASIGVEAEHGLYEFFSATVLEVPREFDVALYDALVYVIRIFGIASKG